MTKAKIIGKTSFEYDAKNKKTGEKTGERKTLGKVYLTAVEEGTEGLCAIETLVDMDKFATYKVGIEVYAAKFHGKWQIAD